MSAPSTSIDFESLVAVALLAHLEVVQDAAEEQQFVVVVGAGVQALVLGVGSGEDVAAHAVTEDEVWRGPGHVGVGIPGEARVGEAELLDTGRGASVVMVWLFRSD